MAEETDKESNQEEVHHQQPMSTSSLEGTNGSSSIESIPQATSHSDSYYSSDIGSTEHLVVVLEAETSFGSKHDPITQFIAHNNNNHIGKGGFQNGTCDDMVFSNDMLDAASPRGLMIHRGSLTNGTTSPVAPSPGGVGSSTGGEPGMSSSDGTRRHSKSSSLPHGVKLCSEKDGDSQNGSNGQKQGSSSSSEENIARDEDQASSMSSDKWASLEEELRKAQSELKAKNAEVEQLKGIREQVEGELEDLTASLFQVGVSFLIFFYIVKHSRYFKDHLFSSCCFTASLGELSREKLFHIRLTR